MEESIVYLKVKDGNYDLYKSDLLGQWEERLTTNPGMDWSPNWIQSLEEFTYFRVVSTGGIQWVKRKVYQNRFDTIPGNELLNPKLSPDGQWIYYIQEIGQAKNIHRVKINGSEVHKLTNSDHYDGRISLDQKHEQMAFISDRTGSNQLYVMDLNSLSIRQLTFGPMIAKYHSFSPDGKKIAVCLATPANNPKWDIHIIDLQTGGSEQLTKTPYSEQEIAWSLSGKKIAFHGSSENDGDQIYTIDISDGKFTKITSGDFYHGEPIWVSNN